MKEKNCLIFGGSGHIGRQLIRALTKNNYKLTVVTRNIHQKSLKIKTQANAGYLNIVEMSIFDEKKLRKLFSENNICINLVGILYEKNKKNSFENLHTNFPAFLAKLCDEFKLSQFIHISALGIENSKESKYSKSKLDGEKKILNYFPKSTILRPSIVYSVDDNFTTTFMTLLKRLPIFPVYYNGETKFQPIHCSDLIEIIYYMIENNIKSEVIECVGPEILSFKDILRKLLISIDRKRLILPVPLIFGTIIATILEKMPQPLLTRDQLKILKYDNIVTKNNKTQRDFGINSNRVFDEEIKKYSHMWREGGEFSTEKYTNQS